MEKPKNRRLPLLRMLRSIAKVQRGLKELGEEVERQAEVGECSRCHRILPWRELNDESTQEEEYVICLKCIGRRLAAHKITHKFEGRPSNRAKCVMCGEGRYFPMHPM